ncbi:MAG: hypothetical protein QXS38_01530 [Candidatus Pacearchaeota archaeon]
MVNHKTLVSLVAIFALAILSIASVSASGSISVEVSGVQTNDLAVFAGQTLPVRVIFSSDNDATDVRVKAWISGEKEYAVSTERFDMIAGKVYSRLLSVQVPSRIEPSEDLNLEILVESRNDGTIVEQTVSLTAQRESYNVEILDVVMDSEVNAGEKLALDVVLKNRGRQFSDDTFVKATIPALGIERKAYFGDLAPVDQSNPDKEDAVEKRIELNIPSNAPTGLYLIELEVYNADSSAVITKKVSIVGGAGENSQFVASASSKTFAVGEKATYSLTLVNAGSKIRVYELVPETPNSLAVSLNENVVAIPAGESKTVKFEAVASKEGKYNFAVNIYSDSELVKRYNFLASVEGKSSAIASNATVVLTVILAIIFVVLLVVLIVLLTRKPENKTEEFGESYY